VNSIRPGRHELILHPDGAEFRYGHRAVWCPWALFNVHGTPFLQNAETLHPVVYVPVRPEAVPAVELRHDGRCIAQGMALRAPQVSFPKPNLAIIYSWYAAEPAELAGFLLELGRTLGTRMPAVTAPPEAFPVDTPVGPSVDARGWLTVQAPELAFPPVCFDCGGATLDCVPFSFGLLGYALLLSFPVCAVCQGRYARAIRRGSIAGAGTLALLGVLLGWFAPARQTIGPEVMLAFALLGGLLGWRPGGWLAERWSLPVRVRWWWFSGPKVRLRFLRAGYTDRVLNAMQAGSRS
jgi:hypothetical protein